MHRPHVVFVDDEPRILDGLRRMLRTHRTLWDMSFAEGGAAALAILQAQHCDVLVTDYRMPGMDGAQLLERVRTDFPSTARVILSGQTNEDNLLKIVMLTHEFISKPSTPEQIIATVERLVAVGGSAIDEEAQRDVSIIESLPSAPETLIELIAALDAEDASPQSVAAVIETDPAATAKVLHLVNSSAYTTSRKVSNVAQAIALLGLHVVRGLVLLHDLVRTFDLADKLPAEWIKALTQHAVESSRLARQLGAGAEWENDAFTAGLLHEVGQLVLASSRPVAFGEVLGAWRGADGQSAPGEDTSLAAAELAAFGVCHNDVGARLLLLWGLPTRVVEAVSEHDRAGQPDAAVDATSAVALAHTVVEAGLGPVCGCREAAATLDMDRLDEKARAAVTWWQRELARQQRGSA
jgi:HD-like signal output (HDOD) protein/CheY-like chemotaxis protein